MKKYCLLAILITLLVIAFGLFKTFPEPVLACGEDGKDCQEKLCGGDFEFPFPPGFPFPHLKPCPKPTPTGSQPTPTPTPTSVPGGGGNGESGGGGGPVGGQGGPACSAFSPAVPTLLSVSRTGHEAVLIWTEAAGATHYALAYGPSAGNYLYGVANVGNTTSFTVGGLDSGQNYCFAVAAVADCASSPISNEKCLSEGQVLGVSTGRVLGLSDTSGEDLGEQIFKLLGGVWVLLGLKILAWRK